MKKLLPHEGIIGKRQGGHRMVRGLPHGGGAIGRSIWHPLAGIWHIGPTRKKQMALGIIPRAICGY